MSFRKNRNETGEEMPGKISHAVDSPKQPESQDKAADQTQAEPQQQEQAETQADSTPEPKADEEEEEPAPPPQVPDGTTAEVLRWVGDDKERAQAALDKEQANPKPRGGLTGELKKILG